MNTREPLEFGAGEESRTLDLNLGKVALYQLSYSRMLLQRYINRDRLRNIAAPQ
jgi:hypothetical protein